MPHSLIPMYLYDGRGKKLRVLPTYPSTLPHLPTEVWERILDELDTSDWEYSDEREQTFAACCSTCRSWIPRSRYHLFKTVKVRSKGQVKQVSSLLHFIPALQTRVEKLTVCGSKGARKDASWIGFVGFHLGPKLKGLEKIEIENVDFSLAKLEFYQFWGAFNKSWKPDVKRRLEFRGCFATHVNQLVRLAFVTKAGELYATTLGHVHRRARPDRPAPALPPGISLPLRRLSIHSYSPKLMSTGSWHTLARQSPSLSSVDLAGWNEATNFSPSVARLFLVSAFDMFRCMQRRNATSDVTISGFDFFPKTVMRTRPDRANANDTQAPPTTGPRLRRELILEHAFFGEAVELFAQVLTFFEDAMVPGENNVNRGFHLIQLVYSLESPPPEYVPTPESFRTLDTILSRLRVTTPDAHLVIEEQGRSHDGCVLPRMRECFPMFCQLLPSAFCDPDGGRPCLSHPIQASETERGQGTEGEDRTAEDVVGSEPEIHATTATRKCRAAEEMEAGEEVRGKRRRAG